MWELDFSKCWLSGNKPLQDRLFGNFAITYKIATLAICYSSPDRHTWYCFINEQDIAAFDSNIHTRYKYCVKKLTRSPLLALCSHNFWAVMASRLWRLGAENPTFNPWRPRYLLIQAAAFSPQSKYSVVSTLILTIKKVHAYTHVCHNVEGKNNKEHINCVLNRSIIKSLLV